MTKKVKILAYLKRLVMKGEILIGKEKKKEKSLIRHSIWLKRSEKGKITLFDSQEKRRDNNNLYIF